jgi:hypothetical protein
MMSDTVLSVAASSLLKRWISLKGAPSSHAVPNVASHRHSRQDGFRPVESGSTFDTAPPATKLIEMTGELRLYVRTDRRTSS